MGLLSVNMPMVLSRSLSVSSGADSWLLLAGAIVPPVILLVYIYMRDPHEKEPIGLLAKLFFLGVLSCIPAALFEYLGQDIILKESGIKEVHLYFFILCFLIIALAEEGFKYIMLYLGSWKSKYFNYRFDGIVYSVFVSLGFATIENVMYVFNSTGGMSTAIARALLSIPGHCTFGIYMGYYYGQAKYREAVGDIQGSRSQRRTGIITAIILHGIYDFCLMVSSAAREYIFIGVFFIFIIVLSSTATITPTFREVNTIPIRTLRMATAHISRRTATVRHRHTQARPTPSLSRRQIQFRPQERYSVAAAVQRADRTLFTAQAAVSP